MSCKDCNKMEEEKKITYYRWDNANIGIFVCKKHAKEILFALDAGQRKLGSCDSDLAKKLAVIGDLLEKIYKKEPPYVSFDIKFCTYNDTKEGELKYNFYTPTLYHNTFEDFNLFVEFLTQVVDGEDVNIRRLTLLDHIKKAENIQKLAKTNIETAAKELKELEEQNEHDGQS